MKSNNIVLEKSYLFAVKIVNQYKFLRLLPDVEELVRLIGSIQRIMKNKIKNYS